MANEIPFDKRFQRAFSNKLTFSPPIRSSSLTSIKQNRLKDDPVCSDYRWILQSDEKRLTHQKNLEERQKILINELSSYQQPIETSIDYEVDFLPGEPVLVSVNRPYFDLTNGQANINELSCQLARLAGKMLDKIHSLCQETHLPFNKQFRLELRPVSFFQSDSNNHLWELRLNLDPVVWFDYHWKTCENRGEFLHQARTYVDKFRHFIKHEHLPDPKFEPLASERHCRYQTTCEKEGGKYTHALHSTLICLENGPMLRDDGLQKCGQFFVNTTIAMQWSLNSIFNSHSSANDQDMDYGLNFNWDTSSFVFTSKRETVRDLVMYATPPWHTTNRKLSRLPLFWTTVIYACRFLHSELRLHTNRENIQWPVNAIALNFGKWETGGSYSTHAIDCHAHTHFLLTREFVSECNENFFRPLQGRQNAPPDYFHQNAEILERERLLSYELRSYQQTLGELKTQVDDMQNNMKKIMTLLENILSKS